MARFDPATETFQSWPIPSGNLHAGIVRHMRETRDGNLLIHQSSTNRIILVTLGGREKTQQARPAGEGHRSKKRLRGARSGQRSAGR